MIHAKKHVILANAGIQFIIIFFFLGCATNMQEQRVKNAAIADHATLVNLAQQRVEIPHRVASQSDVTAETPQRATRNVKRNKPVARQGNIRYAATAPVAVPRQPEATLPCYLHSVPQGIPESDVIIISNRMPHPVGLRLNGLPLQIVGATPPTTRALLPYGVQVFPNMLPPDYKCFVVPYRMTETLHFEAIMYRINPYNATPQIMLRGKGWYQIRYPRRWSWELVIDRMFWL